MESKVKQTYDPDIEIDDDIWMENSKDFQMACEVGEEEAEIVDEDEEEIQRMAEDF